jgi:hypothetical protein
MSKIVKARNPRNPHLWAVNGKPGLPKKGKRRNPSRRRNPDLQGVGSAVIFGSIGALATTALVGILPLPSNPWLNAASKTAAGVGLGFLAKQIKVARIDANANYVMAGGAAVGGVDLLRAAIAYLRPQYVPPPAVAEAKAEALESGTVNDIIEDPTMSDYDYYMDYGMDDIVDSVPYGEFQN